MQRQHEEDLTNEQITMSAKEELDASRITDGVAPWQQPESAAAAAAAAGAAASTATGSTGTRKRGAREDDTVGSRKRRDSINGSVCSSAGESFGIDELVQNLEGIEVNFLAESNGNWNDSSSRFSTGMWSLADREQWTCGTCTFDNDPIMSVCEMCGHSKPDLQAQLHQSKPSVADGSRAFLEAESVRVLQEERMQELARFREEERRQQELAQFSSSSGKAPPGSDEEAAVRSASISATASSTRATAAPTQPRRSSSPLPAARRPTIRRETRCHSPKPNLVAQRCISPKRNTMATTPPKGSGKGGAAASVPMVVDMSWFDDSLHLDKSSTNTRTAPHQQQRGTTSNGRTKGVVNLQDSAATSSTFDMSSATFNYFPESQQQQHPLAHHQNPPSGVETEVEQRASTSPASRRHGRSAEC